MTATTTPRWLAGLIAAYGEPLIVRPVYDMSSDTEYTWPEAGLTVRVGESWGTHFVVATRHGGRVVNLGGLEQPPTDADIAGVVALARLDDAAEVACPHLADVLAGRVKGGHDDSTCGWCARNRNRATQPCDCALLPLGTAPVAPCTKPLGHEGLHETARGVQWADPADAEAAS